MIYIKNFIKGFLIGIACIVPGVSGGALAITLGIYEKLIHIASNIFKDFKNNIVFITPILLGGLISIILLSNTINFFLNNYYVETILLFVGFIIGGMKNLFSNIDMNKISLKDILTGLLSFLSIVIIFLINPPSGNITAGFVNLLFVGFIYAFTMIVPGVSGTFFLMLLGFYEVLLEALGFTDIINSIAVLIPFIIGILIGIVILSKIIDNLLKKHKTAVYYAIIGFVLSSVVSIIITINRVTITSFIVGIFTYIVGFVISSRLNNNVK